MDINNSYDFIPEMLDLNYKLTITNGDMNGTRYPTRNTKRTKKNTSTNKNKQSIIK